MCGFTGAISFDKINENKIKQGNNFIECRGPDSKISFSKQLSNINMELMFNRLAIVDLSEQANQPMQSNEFKTTLMFNGEIFNHKELRNELQNKGLKFKTSHSDSETLLIGLSFYGLDFIKKIRGQYSIFFLDEKIRKAYLIRDRLGQKPLYYSLTQRTLIFGSSLISLLKISDKYITSSAQIYNYLNYGVVEAPNTLFENFNKVRPSEIIEINLDEENLASNSFIYWNPENYISEENFNKQHFFDLLSESVNMRTSADVPVANFLSGGLDSTSIIKSQKSMGLDINSFSIYLDNPKYDESAYIKQVVEKYSLNHKSITLSSDINFSDLIDSLESLDEPYSDPSVVPSYILSREISKHFKVAISGDGGDELLGGYERTQKSLQDKSFLGNLFSKLYKIYPPILGTGNKLLSKSNSLEKSYRSYLEDKKLLNLLKIESSVYSYADKLDSSNYLKYKKLLLADYKFYLPEMMMFKVDRTSMSNSLEVRSPFVDNRLVEYVLSTSQNSLKNNRPKQILRSYIQEDFGTDFTARRKQGFVFDVEGWVYSNINFIKDTIESGVVIKNLNKDIVSQLSLYKSRINGQRLWKIFVLENYLSRVRNL